MRSHHTRSLFADLCDRLKGPGIDELLDRPSLTPYQRDAIRRIANLPDPRHATVEQIHRIATDCSSGALECCYATSGIGDLAREILARLRESPELGAPVTEQDMARLERIEAILTDTQQHNRARLERIEAILSDSQDAMHFLATNVEALRVQSDLTLKSRCPHCHGELVTVIDTQSKELRIRCFQQSQEACRNAEWSLHSVEARHP